MTDAANAPLPGAKPPAPGAAQRTGTARPGPLVRYLPVLEWGKTYGREELSGDLLAAVIVTIMLIPQSLAYAMLAGLPPEAGLYASILPILAYAVFGTSRVLAVGPVAVVSLMTAQTLGQVAAPGSAEFAAAALVLAGLSGVFLLGLGLLRAGFLANFLSHPVIAGFITASGLLIAGGQVGPLIGVKLEGQTLPTLALAMWAHGAEANPVTVGLGVAALAFLLWVRRGMKPLLRRIGLGPRLADALTKAGPVLAVAATTAAVWGLGLDRQGVAVVGAIPRALPPLTLPPVSADLIQTLALPAALISIIGFVESVSVAQTLAARRRQKIRPDQELIGLGAANLAAAFSGGFPVTGGFARSVVNADAGARTPAAGAFTAGGLALAALFLTPWLFYLPKATLAATIIVAVLGLVDLEILRRAWSFSRRDFAAVATTIAITLGLGVETGVLAGVLISLGLHLAQSARPHVAEVGLVPGTQHFRNVLRHSVATTPGVLVLRPDESLYFANIRYLETWVLARVDQDPALQDVVLMCSAVNAIDLTALETLEALMQDLSARGIRLHLSEVKGPVMDRLRRSAFLDHLTGQVFQSQFDAHLALAA